MRQNYLRKPLILEKSSFHVGEYLPPKWEAKWPFPANLQSGASGKAGTGMGHERSYPASTRLPILNGLS
jgi:hypothetical protein